MEFKDHFSEQSNLYSRYRPDYPRELFEFLFSVCERHDLAWDCATGNGQAAVSLAEKFARVVATDASEKQIGLARPHERIGYRVASAYESGLRDGSVDIVTVAQAMHWFDPAKFYSEVRRVLRPSGVIAIWGYGDPVLDTEPIQQVVHDYNRGTIERYWQPERDLLLDEYRSIPFPFRKLAPPRLTMERWWTLDELTGYLRTWSATTAYAAEIGGDPVATVEADLLPHWGKKEERHLVRWPLFVRAGYP